MPDYAAYGLTFRVPFACSALPVAGEGVEPDLEVIEGSVPRDLEAPVAAGVAWQAEPGRYLWRGGRRAGRFLVEGGQAVTLDRGPAAEDEMLAFHFLDTVLAAILRQRGLLVLHANSAVTPTGAVAISGESGAGKTTTLAALVRRGCAMLADDISVLSLDGDGRPVAHPGAPQLHLCEDAAAGLGEDIAELPRYRWRRMKAAVPAKVAPEPAPLRALYYLRADSGSEVRLTPLGGARKFAVVQQCIYGPLLPQEHPNAFPLFAAVSERVPVFYIDRPSDRWTADEVAKVLLDG